MLAVLLSEYIKLSMAAFGVLTQKKLLAQVKKLSKYQRVIGVTFRIIYV